MLHCRIYPKEISAGIPLVDADMPAREQAEPAKKAISNWKLARINVLVNLEGKREPHPVVMMEPSIQVYPVAAISFQLFLTNMPAILQRRYARHTLKNNPAATKDEGNAVLRPCSGP
jgi:hypothetical protein